MRAIVLKRGARSPALISWPEPTLSPDADTMLETVEVGLCGTDALMLDGIEGAPPAGEESLVLGHEGLARVLTPAPGSGLAAGDLVVSAVRWPDAKPCEACAGGRADLCLNEGWTEHGIRGRHGFMVDRWSTDSARLLVVPPSLRAVAVLLEPLSVVVNLLAKLHAVEEVRLGRGDVAVVVGAGPIGILAACLLTLEGRRVLVVDRLSAAGRRGRAIAGLSIEYLQVTDLENDAAFAERLTAADVVIEAAGATAVVLPALTLCRANGTVAVLGTGQRSLPVTVDSNELAQELVQHNKAVIGSVNASFEHLRSSVTALAAIEQRWPGRLEAIIDRYPPADLGKALQTPTDQYVKSVISFS